MTYDEYPPPPDLAASVKAFWTLDGSGAPGEWIEHQAVPDGCVEIIRRLSGRSQWNGEQPAMFVAGMADRPATFRISGDARFAAIRLWPWAWPYLSPIEPEAMWDRWLPMLEPELAVLADLLPDFEAAGTWLNTRLPPLGLGEVILSSTSVAEIRTRTGMGARALQRWFGSNIGMSPSRYLRVLRFQKAFAQVGSEPSLAEHAAAHGFADQAHMAREFKALAGTPAGDARRRATGPFLH